jgi:uncharacterized membrane protein YbhN (UPF0104 family)
MKKNLKRGRLKRLLLPLKLAVVVLVFWYIFRDVDIGKIKSSLGKLPWYVFCLAFLIQYVILASQSLRWKLMINDNAIRLRECFSYTAVSYSLGLLSPSKIASDSLVAYFMGRKKQMALKSVSSLLMGRIMGILVLLVAMLVAFPAHLWMFNDIIRIARTMNHFWLLLAVVVACAIVLMSLRYKKSLMEKFHFLVALFGNPSKFAMIGFYSFIAQSGYVITPYILFQFMDIPVSFINVLFLIPLLSILTYLPVTPAVIGIREGLYIFFFTLLPGVTKEEILACFGFGYTIFFIVSITNVPLIFFLLGKPLSDFKNLFLKMK